jgi:hypothetical protein
MELLVEVSPESQFLWNNKQVVPIYVPEQREPWAAIQTKKLDAVYLHLTSPKGKFTLGQATGLGYEPSFDGTRANTDAIRLKFRSSEDLERGNLKAFLNEFVSAVRGKK